MRNLDEIEALYSDQNWDNMVQGFMLRRQELDEQVEFQARLMRALNLMHEAAQRE